MYGRLAEPTKKEEGELQFNWEKKGGGGFKSGKRRPPEAGGGFEDREKKRFLRARKRGREGRKNFLGE